MISRRLLRIKALTVLYAFNRNDRDELVSTEKELALCISKSYDLYHYILLLVIEIADLAAEKIELGRNKKIPSHKDLNPNTRFINNSIIRFLENNKSFKIYIEKTKLSWHSYPGLLRKLYSEILNWDVYNSYVSQPQSSFKNDKKFIIRLITELIVSSEDLHILLEELSIYWNDDLEFISIMIEKTLRGIQEDSDADFKLMPLYKNSEDEIFVKTLLRKTIIHSGKYSKLIDKKTTNWDLDRVALMDILVMQLAISEIIEFDEIPVKVTLNEYIEIAKFYCTAKSSNFVNGILDEIVKELRQKKSFSKKGKGLIGETILNQTSI